MNILARCVLEMYTFDPNPDDISRDNLMRQSIELIAKFPTIIAYAYNIYRHSVQVEVYIFVILVRISLLQRTFFI